MLCIEYMGGFGGFDRSIYDLFFRIRGEGPPDARIIVVAIDEKTLGKQWAWPINRRYYADLIDRLGQADAVGLNLILAEPSDEDARLIPAQKDQCPVFLPVYIDHQAGIVFPGPTLARFPTGHIHVERDIDCVIRNVFHTLYYERRQVPSFAAALFNALPDREFHHTEWLGTEAHRRIPSHIRQIDSMGINFYGGGGTFQRLSFIDVIDGRWDASFFNHQIPEGRHRLGVGDGPRHRQES